jgi:hypothetical protein
MVLVDACAHLPLPYHVFFSCVYRKDMRAVHYNTEGWNNNVTHG